MDWGKENLIESQRAEERIERELREKYEHEKTSEMFECEALYKEGMWC